MIKQLLVNVLAFYIIAYIIPGITITGWQTLFVLALVWGVLTLIVRPLLVILTLPINLMTLGLFTFVINALLLLLASNIVPGFQVAGFGTALLAAIVFSLINGFLSSALKRS